MKKIVILFVFALIFVGNMSAQQKQQSKLTPEESAQRQTNILARNLELTDEQKDKVYNIFLKYAKPIVTWDRETDLAKQKEFLQKRMEEKDAEIKDVLTEEQNELYDVLRKKTEERKQKKEDRNKMKKGKENKEQQEQEDKQQ